MSTPERGRILGIGGIFFKSPEHEKTRAWYEENLGLKNQAMLPWRSDEQPDAKYFTVWSIFPGATKYLDPSTASFMINYIVDDLDVFLAKLSAGGVKIDPKREDHEYGKFAWIYDPDGNKIELWQPPAA